jgi:hypothetical protein
MREGIRAEYLHCLWKTTLEDWYRHWFYIREEPSHASYCDVSLVLEKTDSWKELPQNTIQIEAIMQLVPWSRLDGPRVVGNFISHRIQPCQARIHTTYEYKGLMDPTRMRNEDLEPKEVKMTVRDLFNQKDPSFRKLTVIETVFKLTRPPPLVSQMLSDNLSLRLKYCITTM